MRSRESICAVSLVPGRAMTRISVFGRTLSSSSSVYISSYAGSPAFLVRRTPRTTLAPSALARRAKLVPMSPVPRTVMLLPQIERMGSPFSQPRSRTICSKTGICRRSISVTMMICSEMVTP